MTVVFTFLHFCVSISLSPFPCVVRQFEGTPIVQEGVGKVQKSVKNGEIEMRRHQSHSSKGNALNLADVLTS
jgi:hypothetical protein